MDLLEQQVAPDVDARLDRDVIVVQRRLGGACRYQLQLLARMIAVNDVTCPLAYELCCDRHGLIRPLPSAACNTIPGKHRSCIVNLICNVSAVTHSLR